MKDSDSISAIKRYISSEDSTPPPCFLTCYNRIAQTIHCKLRLGMSDLNQHLVDRHLQQNAQCACNTDNETPEHFLLKCNRFTAIRQLTISTLKQSFQRVNILLNGDPANINVDENELIFMTVQEYIHKSKRF